MNSSGQGQADAGGLQLHVKSYRVLSDRSLPDEEGKFVILAKGQGLHVVFSPIALTPYHANIVYQYLQIEGRGKVEAVSSSGCRILSPGWRVHGGGYYQVQHGAQTLTLQGKSTAFGKYQGDLLRPFLEEILGLLGLTGFYLELK